MPWPEDSLVWLRGRHSLKFGYRLVDRYASPFTNTDTRGTINFGRNYTNNPVNNSGGSGLALKFHTAIVVAGQFGAFAHDATGAGRPVAGRVGISIEVSNLG